jgi:hypothetical protein
MAERTHAQQMEFAGLLRQALHALMRTEGSMSSADVLQVCTEFWVQVFVDAFLAEARLYPGRSWAEVMGELTGVLDEMQRAAKRRLALAWKDDNTLWTVPGGGSR